MVFLLASFYEFTLFLKIVLWIAVPLIIVSFVVTTILHYRQKRKNAANAALHPEIPATEVLDISLVSRLQKEVLHYRRRIKELQHALSFAKNAAPGAVTAATTTIIQPAETPTVNQNTPLEVNIDSTATMGVPSESLSQISESPVFLNADALPPHGEIPSAAYLNDLVNEQKTHVYFLQQQLESRIKSYHELETQFRDNASLVEKMTLSYEHVRHQLDDSEAAASMLRIEKDSLQAKINRLESSLQELQEQHNKTLKLLSANPAADESGSVAVPATKTSVPRKPENRLPAEN